MARNCPLSLTTMHALSLTTNDSHGGLLESLTRVRRERDAGVMVTGRQRFAIKRLWAQLPVYVRPQQRLGIKTGLVPCSDDPPPIN